MNLPVEFDASNRAKAQLVDLGIIDPARTGLGAQRAERRRLDLRGRARSQSVMMLLYYISRFTAAAATDRGDRPTTLRGVYFRARGCFSGSQAPLSALLATDCWMKYIPSTPSLTLG